MAITVLTQVARKKSTYAISGAFTDDDGSAVTPTSLNWSLSTTGGTIINSRSDVSVSSPAVSTTVVLSGSDLALRTGESGLVRRRFTFKGTYNSSLGSGLLLKDECEFQLQDLVNVS